MLTAQPCVDDLKRYSRHKRRRLLQKANKHNSQKAVQQQVDGIGQLYWVSVMTGLAPYNSHGRTQWLIDTGCVCLAEKVLSGYKLYLTKGFPYQTLAEIKKHCKSYIARKTEIKILDKPVKIAR